MTEKNKRTEPIKVSNIKVAPQPGIIIVELIKVISKVEKDLKKKSPDLILTEETIQSRIKQVIETTKDITNVYEEHPDQAIIIALPYELAEERQLRVGDKIAFHRSEHALRPIIYHKKRYHVIYPSEILFRYLTDEV